MLRARLQWLKHLFYAALALIVLGGLAEVGLRVYDSATGQITRQQLYDRGLVCKSWFTHHTLRPSQVFAVKHPDSGEKIRVVVNSHACRGPEPVIPKPPGTFRILCLGDEQTLAPYIVEEQSYCRLVEQGLRDVSPLTIEVINAGLPDSCPLLSYLQLRQSLLLLAPDVIVLQFDFNDVGDDYAYRRYLTATSAGLPLSCAHPDLEFRKNRKKTSQLESALLLPGVLQQHALAVCSRQILAEPARTIDSPTGRYAWLDANNERQEWDPYIDQALEPLSQLADLAAALPAELLVVVIPAPWQISAQAGNELCRQHAGVAPGACFTTDDANQRVEKYCHEKRISLLDLTSRFRALTQPEQLYLQSVPQLSPEGHRVTAGELSQRLETLLPGNGPQPRARRPRPAPLLDSPGTDSPDSNSPGTDSPGFDSSSSSDSDDTGIAQPQARINPRTKR